MVKTKTFDCVEMKRQGGREVYKRIKDMTSAQELAYWKKRSAQLDREIKAAKLQRAK
jgi:hypothetical protein